MLTPPFKLAGAAVAPASHSHPCCDEPECSADKPSNGRARLAQLNSHFHCSVIGTCLSTADLAKIVARFVDVGNCSDVEVHHDAVSLAHQGGAAAKALNKALDQRHDAVVRSFSKARDAEALATLWDEALQHGEVPGAYWALLTHREVTPELRQKAFGDVHMLSHLVGAANRADIRRLVALEKENGELRERLERQQLRSQEVVSKHDEAMTR